MPARSCRFFFPLCASTGLLCASAQARQLPAPAAAGTAPSASTNAAPSTLTSPADAAKQMIASAIQKMNANDQDGAMNDLSQAIKVNPNSTGAYVLRASIYCQKKQWTQADDDFKTAAKIAPGNAVLKFNLIEVKFLQKQYDAARPGFVALEKDADVLKGDPEMVDFAAY